MIGWVYLIIIGLQIRLYLYTSVLINQMVSLMEALEIIVIAMLSTAFALITWYIFYSMTDIGFFQSFYAVLIFPVIFATILIFIRYLIKSPYKFR